MKSPTEIVSKTIENLVNNSVSRFAWIGFIGLVFGNLFLIFMHENFYKFRCLTNFVSELTENPSKIMGRLIGGN